MKNPIKSVAKAVQKKLKYKHEVHEKTPDQKRLFEIWPAGTWSFKATPPDEVWTYDNVVRGLILKSWKREYHLEAEKHAGHAISEKWAPTPAIPHDWYPSSKGLKHEIEDTHKLHYVVATLKELGHLRT
ncbi:MAG: hypothetical protein JO290_03095 [Sphingomonadaceae bacterium]|nr:hypothetical protein [Sphingomonadaceae bacterium]